MPVIELLIQHPLPCWQRRCAESLAAVPGVALRLRPIAAPSGGRPWRAVADRCRMLKPEPAVPMPQSDAAADQVIDLVGSGSGRRWLLVRDDGRPLAAPFPFAACWSRPEAVGAVLLMDEDGRVLRSAHLAVNGRLYHRMLDDVLRTAALLPALAWRDRLHGTRAEGGTASCRSAARKPLLGLAAGAARYAATRLRAATHVDIWRVGLVDAPIHAFLDPGFRPAIEWVTPAEDVAYCADPFANPDDPEDIWWERYDYRGRRGTLQHTRLGNGAAPETVNLGIGCHMSYPYMTRLDGRTVLVPEMSGCGHTRLYALAAGGRPELLSELPVPGIDPVLFAWEDRFWLGLTRADLDNRANFCLWHAAALEGPWTEHAANPVKIDVRSARGAGTVFAHQGWVYRPAQDCSVTYGGQVVINRLLCCTPTAFREEVAAVVRPQPDWPAPDGLHTLSACGGRTLIDAKLSALNAAGITAKLQRIGRRRPSVVAGELGSA